MKKNVTAIFIISLLAVGAGGSKIIFLSQSTQIMKTSAATSKDLTAGEQVSVNGKTNTDGSVHAETIQIRPPLPPSS